MKRKLLLSVFLFSVFGVINLPAQKRIFTLGDSTMANYDEDKNSGENEMRGWAQMLPQFIKNDSLKIINVAKNGRSSKSFYYEIWETLREDLHAGDYVFIQFGHNDEKENGLDTDFNDKKGRGTSPWGQYQYFLQKYITETRAKGAIPILITPVVRRYFKDGNLTEKAQHNLSLISGDTTLNYPLVMRKLAQKYNVPLIDMTRLTNDLVVSFGEKKSKEIIYVSKDDTHLKAMGAVLFAQTAVRDLIRQGLFITDFNPDPKYMLNRSAINFGIQPVGTESVKSFNILPVNGNRIKFVAIKTSGVFSISDKENGVFSKKVNSDKFNGLSIFVKFHPRDTIVNIKHLKVCINQKDYLFLPLTGKGVGIGGSKTVNVTWSGSDTEMPAVDTNIIICNTSTAGLKEALYKPATGETAHSFIPNDTVWPANEIDVNTSRYVEYSISTQKGELYINDIHINTGARGENIWYTIVGSLEPDFSRSNSFIVMEQANNDRLKEYRFNQTGIKVGKGKTYRLRIYPWCRANTDKESLLVGDLRLNLFFFEQK